MPSVIDMLVAILSTKLPILLGQGFLGFADPSLNRLGLWRMLHEARTDIAMLLSCTFLAWVSEDPWSLDALLAGRRRLVPGFRSPHHDK